VMEWVREAVAKEAVVAVTVVVARAAAERVMGTVGCMVVAAGVRDVPQGRKAG